jgi:hypothetical protein
MATDDEKFAQELLRVIKEISCTNEIGVKVMSNPFEGKAFFYIFQKKELINDNLKKQICTKKNQMLIEYIARQGVKEIIFTHADLPDYVKMDLGWILFCISNNGSIDNAY